MRVPPRIPSSTAAPTIARVATVAAAVLLLAACGDGTAPADADVLPNAQITADVAATTGDEVARDVEELLAGEALAGAEPWAHVAGAAPEVSLQRIGNQRACAYDAASGRHTCPVFTVEGMTMTHSYAILDASNRPMERYSASLTAAMNFRRTVDGTLNGTRGGAPWSVTRHHARDYTVSGLAGEETTRTWNGTGSSADTSSHGGERGARTYIATGTHVTTNVVFAVPRSANRWPRSGTIERTVSGSATVTPAGGTAQTRPFARTVRVTFDGDATAQLVVTGANGTATCTLDLATRQVSGCA